MSSKAEEGASRCLRTVLEPLSPGASMRKYEGLDAFASQWLASSGLKKPSLSVCVYSSVVRIGYRTEKRLHRLARVQGRRVGKRQ